MFDPDDIDEINKFRKTMDKFYEGYGGEMKMFRIEKINLDGSVETIKKVCALTAGEALERVGLEPDAEENSLSGYYPLNEYGRGWFPHFEAKEEEEGIFQW